MADDRMTLARAGGMSVTEAARFLGVSRSTLYVLMAAGQLPYAKIGHRRVVPAEALVAYLAAALTGGPAPAPGGRPAC